MQVMKINGMCGSLVVLEYLPEFVNHLFHIFQVILEQAYKDFLFNGIWELSDECRALAYATQGLTAEQV